MPITRGVRRLLISLSIAAALGWVAAVASPGPELASPPAVTKPAAAGNAELPGQ
ncbi:MAG: hypothetical protein U0R50_06850 [Gaiellales bacterium]